MLPRLWYAGTSALLPCVLSCLLLLLITPPVHAARSTFLPPTVSVLVGPQAVAPQDTQQAFTLDGVQTLTLMFRIKQLPRAPTPPPAYVGLPEWTFAGGEGYLLVTRGDYGAPIGRLTEMMYFPGKFRPCNGSTRTFYSAQRFWVDSDLSRFVGRSYWGFPKVSGCTWLEHVNCARHQSRLAQLARAAGKSTVWQLLR